MMWTLTDVQECTLARSYDDQESWGLAFHMLKVVLPIWNIKGALINQKCPLITGSQNEMEFFLMQVAQG